jgi:23S rRNA pseudouridine1911/1915/1917 synthase
MNDPEVLYLDNHLLVLNKPPGLLTQPSGTQQESLEGYAKAWIKRRENKPGNVYLHAVHRLDAPVSGIVLFARTSKALSRLNEAIRERSTHKTYLAVVSTSPQQEQQTIEHYLIHDHHMAKVVNKGAEGAQHARLTYRVLVRRDSYTLLEVNPETGRYHQIRAQLAAIGCPILGDRRYGGPVWSEGEGIALQHQCLQFVHPVTQEPLVIKAPFPKNWPIRPSQA